MKKFTWFYFITTFAGTILAEDIPIEAIRTVEIQKILPNEWRLESIHRVRTVAGWTKLNGSNGIRLTISRTPYDTTLHRQKGGGLAIYIPRFYLYIFPPDFEGRHVGGRSVFRNGKVITDHSLPPPREVGDLVMNYFVPIGEWYVFHGKRTFPDWAKPVADIVKAMQEVPNKEQKATR